MSIKGNEEAKRRTLTSSIDHDIQHNNVLHLVTLVERALDAKANVNGGCRVPKKNLRTLSVVAALPLAQDPVRGGRPFAYLLAGALLVEVEDGDASTSPSHFRVSSTGAAVTNTERAAVPAVDG